MAEVVGLVASIIQIAGTGAKLSTALYHYTTSAVRADQDITEIASDVDLTSNALESIGKVFETEYAKSLVSNKAIHDAKSIIKRCEAVFNDITELVDKRRKMSKDGKKSLGVMGKLTWPLKEQRVELYRRRLESLKTSLALLLHVLQLAQGQARGQLEKRALELEREKIRELHQRQQDSLKCLQILETKMSKIALDDEETMQGLSVPSRVPTMELIAVAPVPMLSNKDDIITADISEVETETSESDATVSDEEDEPLSLEELAKAAKHVQKLMKRITKLQQNFGSASKGKTHRKKRVKKMYQRFCREWESSLTIPSSPPLDYMRKERRSFIPLAVSASAAHWENSWRVSDYAPPESYSSLLASSVPSAQSHQHVHDHLLSTTWDSSISFKFSSETDTALEGGVVFDMEIDLAPNMAVSNKEKISGDSKPKEPEKSADLPSYDSSTRATKGSRQRMSEGKPTGPINQEIKDPINGIRSPQSPIFTHSSVPPPWGSFSYLQHGYDAMFIPSQALHIRTNSESKTESDPTAVSTSNSHPFPGGLRDLALGMGMDTIFDAQASSATSTFCDPEFLEPRTTPKERAVHSSAWIESYGLPPVCLSSHGYVESNTGCGEYSDYASIYPFLVYDTLLPPLTTGGLSGGPTPTSQNDFPKSDASSTSEQKHGSLVQPHIKRDRSSSVASVEGYEEEGRKSKKLRRTGFQRQSSRASTEAASTSTRDGDERDIVDILLDQWTIPVY